MALAYNPPGVFVSETVGTSINPLLAVPASVCIIGPARGFVQRTDLLGLTNTDTVALPNFPSGATLVNPLVSVSNVNDPNTTYVQGTDYTVNYSSSVNEVQTVTLTGATGGTFTLAFRDETTATIAYDAAAATVQTALVALGNIETGEASVTGSAGGPYTVTFSGQYADVNVESLIANGTALTGTTPTVAVETPTEGGVKGTVTRVNTGAIEEGETVRVTYNFVPASYYEPTRLDGLSAVEELYGNAFNDDGTIGSSVSYAAQIAFENGARDLVVQALFRRTTDSDEDSAPRVATDTEIQQAATWDQSLFSLRSIDDVNVIVPAIGQSFSGLSDAETLSIFQAVRSHVRYMSDQQQYVIAILGEDSSTTSAVAQKTTLRDHAAALRSADPTVAEQLVFVSPSKFTRSNPVTSQGIYIGGQYFAAGIAGMLAARSVATPLTRETVSGFTAVNDKRSKADRNADAAAGLLVAEQRGNTVQIRHAITLDTTATQRRELSVVRAKHRMVESIRDTIDQQIIGKVIADGDAPTTVASAVASVLTALQGSKELVSFSFPQARTLAIDPTTVEVRFSYKPAFPLNYVNISFSIDLSSGDTTVTV